MPVDLTIAKTPCCTPNPNATDGACCSTAPADPEQIRATVREGYGRIAREGSAHGKPVVAGCCGSTSEAAEQLVKTIGYSDSELAQVPDGANMGLSCGNPTALAELRAGETVLDLGAGGGFDVFIASRKVGPVGRAIGVDMTADMVAKARRIAQQHIAQLGYDNVEFRLGEIEHLPVADESVDVIISNCVINLSPDKPQVWREMHRVLKPGGRVAVSDLALLQPLPQAVVQQVEALIGCVAGAVLVEETRRMAEAAGFVDIQLNAKRDYIDVMNDWQDPVYRNLIAQLPAGAKISDYVTSLEIRARRA